MAEIISTINTGKDENYEMLSKKLVKKSKEELVQLDPNKLCMTSTIVPNKRPIEQRDVDNFVNRVKGIDDNKKKTVNEKVPTKNKETTNSIKKEEKKQRGRPKRNSTEKSPQVHSTVE